MFLYFRVYKETKNPAKKKQFQLHVKLRSYTGGATDEKSKKPMTAAERKCRQRQKETMASDEMKHP